MTAEPERFWSVTTALGEALRKRAIEGWASKFIADAAVRELETLRHFVEVRKEPEQAAKWLNDLRWQKSKEAKVRGSDVHRAAEKINLGQEPDITEAAMPYVEQYLRFLNEFQPKIELAEAPVYNTRYKYAGTLDMILRLDGIAAVLDIKTHDKPIGADPRSAPPFPEVALQLAAYRRADLVGILPPNRVEPVSGGRRFYILPEGSDMRPMPETDGAFALAISPWDYRLHPIRTDEEVWDYFRFALELSKWELNKVSERVIGEAVTPPARRQTAVTIEPPEKAVA